MAERVYKYELQPDITLELPRGAEVLCVANQDNKVCMWAKVEAREGYSRALRRFMAFGTGHALPEMTEMKYVGTVHGVEGWMVFHVFEIL